jgi:hypothetical protein
VKSRARCTDRRTGHYSSYRRKARLAHAAIELHVDPRRLPHLGIFEENERNGLCALLVAGS